MVKAKENEEHEAIIGWLLGMLFVAVQVLTGSLYAEEIASFATCMMPFLCLLLGLLGFGLTFEWAPMCVTVASTMCGPAMYLTGLLCDAFGWPWWWMVTPVVALTLAVIAVHLYMAKRGNER